MTPRFTGHFSIFCLVFFVVKSLLRIVRQCSREKLAILLIKSWSQGSILIYQVWAIDSYEAKVFCFFFFFFFGRVLSSQTLSSLEKTCPSDFTHIL